MDLRKYIYGHCVNPQRIRVWDSYSSSYVVRMVPCGKCLHCHNTHINEWCTRLIAQRLYSKYVYYISLDYAPFDLTNNDARLLARETAACYHDINKTKKCAMHPLVLCKNHLQDFYKRLRKNTGIKLQYFACGEYGMHANGHGFGRPHFHNIIFTNQPLSPSQFENAWSVNGYKIGRVDIQDLSMLQAGDESNIKIFKYVCKYLQKWDFSFEKLATIDYHRAYFKSLNLVLESRKSLFESDVYTDVSSSKSCILSWRDYTKKFSPFVVCSRRPSIGSQYFADNLERFKEQDYRLFGLPSSCTAFPRYYVRRTKEAVFDYRCVGEISQKPTTSSRMGYILQVLDKLYNSSLDIATWSGEFKMPWRVCRDESKGGELCLKFRDGTIPCKSLHFYDSVNKYLYQFNGYSYNVWCKLCGSFSLLYTMDIYSVLCNVSPLWDKYYKNFVVSSHEKRVLYEKDLEDSVYSMFSSQNGLDSYDLFAEYVKKAYEQELGIVYKTKLLMQNSKQEL